MIGCAEAVQLLWKYLDETAEVGDRGLVEEHLSRCRTCCGELEFAKELRRMLARPAGEPLPPDLLQRLNATIEGLG